MLGCLSQPLNYGSLFGVFGTANGRQTVLLGQPYQTLPDGFLVVILTVGDCVFGLHERVSRMSYIDSVVVPLCSTELDDVAVINLAVIWTGLVPAGGNRRNQSSVFHLRLSSV